MDHTHNSSDHAKLLIEIDITKSTSDAKHISIAVRRQQQFLITMIRKCSNFIRNQNKNQRRRTAITNI